MGNRFDFKNSNIKGFLFFLFLTTVVALFNKLSKEYTTTFVLPITVNDIPLNKSLFKQSDADIEITMVLSGFSLLLNTFKTPEVNISVNQLEDLNGRLVYNLNDNKDYLRTMFTGEGKIQKVEPSTISFVLDSFYTKKVKVVSSIDFKYMPGYNASDPLRFEPAEVELIGEQSLLDSVQEIRTVYKTYTDVGTTLEGQVYLDTLHLNPSIRVSPSRVSVYQKVSKFTEGTVIVPIEVINNTETPITIFPKTTEVTYTMALEDIGNIDVRQFKVMCELNENVNNEYIVLKLSSAPKEAKQVRIATKQVQFIKRNE